MGRWGGGYSCEWQLCAFHRDSTEESGFMLWMEWQMGLEETRYSPESRVWQAKASEFPLYLGVATPWNRSEGHGRGVGGRRRDTRGCNTWGDTRCLPSCHSSEKLFTVHLRTVHLGEKRTKMCPAALTSG